MGRTIYKAKNSISVNGAYRCSKCKKITYFQHVIKETSVNSIYGIWHSRKTNQANLDSVKSSASLALRLRVQNITKESNSNIFRSAEYNCRCEHCGHREPWAKMRFGLFELIASEIVLRFSCVSVAILLFAKEWLWSLICSITVIALYLLYKLLKKCIVTKLEKQIALLDKESLPTLFWNDKSEYEYKFKNDREKVMTLKEELDLWKKSDLCIECGAMIKENQKICHVCGRQIKNN